MIHKYSYITQVQISLNNVLRKDGLHHCQNSMHVGLPIGAKDTVDWQMTPARSSPNVYHKKTTSTTLVPTISKLKGSSSLWPPTIWNWTTLLSSHQVPQAERLGYVSEDVQKSFSIPVYSSIVTNISRFWPLQYFFCHSIKKAGMCRDPASAIKVKLFSFKDSHVLYE